jgi:ankyrin repeat protein
MDFHQVMYDTDIGIVNFIKNLPDSKLNTQDMFGRTFLHCSSRCNRIVATKLLIKRGTDIDLQNLYKDTPIIEAIHCGHIDIIEILCAAGADLTKRNSFGKTAIEHALYKKNHDCIPVLIANGSRLNTLYDIKNVEPWMVSFENGVLKCRSATIAMLALKRRGLFKNQCRFIIREIGIAIWATRCDPEWQ